MTLRLLLSFTAIASGLLLAGCNVTTEKHGNGDHVDISTPFGSMQVKTDDDGKSNSAGFSVYPGSVQIRKDNDGNSADITMNFGDFHLGVNATNYQTKDDAQRVISFYRKDMARYGVVIECRGNHIVGKPERTQEGLGCEDEKGNKTNASDDDELQLLAGSPSHQHIVAISNHDGGTRIGLIALTLPKDMTRHTEKESE